MTTIQSELKTVVALRRYNPGKSRGNRPVLEPIFQGEKINARWNLIAPPEGEFRIATFFNGDVAGASPRGSKYNQFVGSPAIAKDRVVFSRDVTSTKGLREELLNLGLVTV